MIMLAPSSRALVVMQPQFTRVEGADIVMKSLTSGREKFHFANAPPSLGQCLVNAYRTSSWRVGFSGASQRSESVCGFSGRVDHEPRSSILLGRQHQFLSCPRTNGPRRASCSLKTNNVHRTHS